MIQGADLKTYFQVSPNEYRMHSNTVTSLPQFSASAAAIPELSTYNRDPLTIHVCRWATFVKVLKYKAPTV